MRLKMPRWFQLLGGLALLALGVVLIVNPAVLPPLLQRWWPVVLIGWGLWNWTVRYRATEDRWAGPDYGTGLYVIRRRRRSPGGWLPGLLLIGGGIFFLWANLDAASGVTIGPIVLAALGVLQLVRSFRPPPRHDFYGE
jgi:uncharacterized membrane protein HdeD (DUF308 family)